MKKHNNKKVKNSDTKKIVAGLERIALRPYTGSTSFRIPLRPYWG